MGPIVRIIIRLAVVAIVGAAIAVAGLYILAQHDAIAPLEAAVEPDAALAAEGELLAAVGDCAVCHTRPGGPAFAGGRPLETPFGTVHSTNITPDPETGIGRWPLAAFVRSMREGIDREGDHLYPVFPYDHFRLVTDEDLAALYAYLMSLEPVAAEPVANTLDFPFDRRMLVAGWNLLYLDEGVFQPDPSRDAEWNRGAYLVEGLGHCGACHSPRDGLGGIVADAPFAGGEAEGWHAPALGAASPAPIAWDVDPMVNYLIDGWDRDHGIAAGPMTAVVNSLYLLPEDDIYAIAAYVVSLQGDAAGNASRRDDAIAFAEAQAFGVDGPPPSLAVTVGSNAALQRGADTFAAICANCHRSDGQTAPLALTATINAPVPDNAIRVILDGIQPPEGSPSRTMRAFDAALSDAELVDLLAFLRAHFSRAPVWTDLAQRVAAIRGDD
ncbi:MAG: cytochrome c [Alphaproteobacteria bacterium]